MLVLFAPQSKLDAGVSGVSGLAKAWREYRPIQERDIDRSDDIPESCDIYTMNRNNDSTSIHIHTPRIGYCTPLNASPEWRVFTVPLLGRDNTVDVRTCITNVLYW
jgi:hypothetical protein